MTFGLTLINQNDIIQIDDNYSNYQIYSVGSVLLNGSTGGTISNLPREAIVLINSTNYNSSVYYWALPISSNNLKQVICYAANASASAQFPGYIQLDSYVTTTLNYIILLPIKSFASLSNTGFGLEVVDKANNLVFSTKYKIPTVIKHALVNTDISQNLTAQLNGFGNLYVAFEVFNTIRVLYYQMTFPDPDRGYFVTACVSFINSTTYKITQVITTYDTSGLVFAGPGNRYITCFEL